MTGKKARRKILNRQKTIFTNIPTRQLTNFYLCVMLDLAKNKRTILVFKFNFTNGKADKVAIVLFIAFVMWYYDFFNKPDLENFNLKEQLPAPQNEIVVRNRDIADAIKHQQKISADFNRMYNELKGWKKITWPSQPVDSASWFRKIHPSPPYLYAPSMRHYQKFIKNYEKDLCKEAEQLAKTKYANYKGNQK